MDVDYPNDADGDALRRVARDGSDMTAPMDIDFAVAVPDERSAQQVAEVVAKNGYSPHLWHDPDSLSWSVYCTKRMLATYEGFLTAQSEIDEKSRPFGGYSDGWGTFGNSRP